MRFVEVWELHSETVRQFCVIRMQGRRDDADEAFSRTAVRAFRKWHGEFSDAEHAKAWLLLVARHVCIDLYRERLSRREVSLDSGADDFHGDTSAFALPSSRGPEDEYVGREQGRLARACIEELPPLLRDAATLYFVGEMPYGEVARQLGITEVNVRKRIQQARERLRDAIRTSSARGRQRPAASAAPAPRVESAAVYVVTVTTLTGLEHDVHLELALPRRDDPRRLERLQANLERHPRSRTKRLELARVLASRGQLGAAIPHYHSILAKQCFPLRPWLELGAILEALGHPSEAIALYKRGAREAGRADDRLHLAALELFARGAVDEAKAAIHDAIARDPCAARQRRLLGRIAFARGDVDESIAALQHCLALDPRDPLAPLLLHTAMCAAGQHAEARQALLHAAEASLDNPALLARAIAELCLGTNDDRARAATFLPLLQRLAPDAGSTRACEALVLLAAGSPSRGEAMMAGYVSRHQRHAAAWRALARIRRLSGRPALGAAVLARDLEPDERESWLELCRVLAAATHPAEMRRTVEAIRLRFAHDRELTGAASQLAAKI